MSLKRVVLLSAVALGVLALVTGCFFGISINQRLEQFVADLNLADRSSLYLNLDPNLPDYDALKDPAYWSGSEGWFPDGGTTPLYALTDVVTNNAGDGTATVTASIDGPAMFGGPWVIDFALVRDGFDWFISSITLDGDQVVPIPPT